MNKTHQKFWSLGVGSILFLFYLLTPISSLFTIHAQNRPIDVTFTYPNIESSAVDGDILFNSGSNLTRANIESSEQIFGVLQQNPVLVYRDSSNQGQPVIRSGIAQVNVTDFNGTISKGDYITSSPVAGKGEKATDSGYVLGIALDNFSGEGAQTVQENGRQLKTGKINVAVRIEFAEINKARSPNRLFDLINSIVFRNIQDPDRFLQLIRYLAAALTVMVAFTISFLTFSRAIAKGVEGIGRNPLARNAIQFSIIINAALTTVIALVGVIASFIILKI